MSRKLQSRIQDIKVCPAGPSASYSPGHPSPTTTARTFSRRKRRWATGPAWSRWTVYENDILEAADGLQRAGSHVCRTEALQQGRHAWDKPTWPIHCSL